MAHKRRLSDIPDFLHNSPYLPYTSDGRIESFEPQAVQKKPTIKEILKWKRLPMVIMIICCFAVLRYIWAEVGVMSHIEGPNCLNMQPIVPPNISDLDIDIASVDWSNYAYGQYATDRDYLCNSVMIFEALQRFDSKAARFLMYPAGWTTQDWVGSAESYLLRKARDEYNVRLVPVTVQQREGDFNPWASSFTKLLAFNQTQYDKIVMLDSDITLLRSLDELFFLPNVSVAMPLAYWLERPYLTSHIMLITPSKAEFSRISNAVKGAKAGEYDMDIINKAYKKNCMLLDHKKYALLTGEFREKDHTKYFRCSSFSGGWDPMKALRYASFVHFSDYPIPKPWLNPRRDQLTKMQPECVTDEVTEVDCTARDIWLEIYRDFRERKDNVCS